MPGAIIWVFDTSSIIEVRRLNPSNRREPVFAALSQLVNDERLVFPPQALAELARKADPKNPDMPHTWAKLNEAKATARGGCTFEELRGVLAVAPVLDPYKDSGADEADPYVLAVALRLRAEGHDARIVTQEKNDTPTKMSLNTAAGVLGIPSLPLAALLALEGIG